MTRAGVTVTECEGTLVISLIIKKMESSQILNTVILPQNFSSPSHLRENVQFLIKPILRSRDLKTNSAVLTIWKIPDHFDKVDVDDSETRERNGV